MAIDRSICRRKNTLKRPWMPLYITDYKAKTAHLNAAKHGAYLLLIMHYWINGTIPTDDDELAQIACMRPIEWKRVKPTILAFFTSDFRHLELDGEIAKAIDISSKRQAAAEARHSKSNANVMQLHSKSNPIDKH
jgi:uncharacterized protein YdaU (DUF1376 family)